jgi:hypothetical protein
MEQATVLSDRFLGGMLGRVPLLVSSDEPLPFHKRGRDRGLLNLQKRGTEVEVEIFHKRNRPSPRVTKITDVVTATAAVSALTIVERLLAERPVRSLTPSDRPGFPRPVVGAISENSKRVIGENGVKRFEEFRHYHDGWDYSRGKALSPRSVATFEVFLRLVPELAAVEPSLFLTPEGNLQLGWEDSNGGSVEVDFLLHGVEYYLDTAGEEGTVRLEALPQFIERIRATIP